jgi:hypothetical protein
MPGMCLMARDRNVTSPSVAAAVTVRKKRAKIKYTASLLPPWPIVPPFCCIRCCLLYRCRRAPHPPPPPTSLPPPSPQGTSRVCCPLCCCCCPVVGIGVVTVSVTVAVSIAIASACQGQHGITQYEGLAVCLGEKVLYIYIFRFISYLVTDIGRM